MVGVVGLVFEGNQLVIPIQQCVRAEDRARKERWRTCQRKLEQQYTSYPMHTIPRPKCGHF